MAQQPAIVKKEELRSPEILQKSSKIYPTAIKLKNIQEPTQSPSRLQEFVSGGRRRPKGVKASLKASSLNRNPKFLQKRQKSSQKQKNNQKGKLAEQSKPARVKKELKLLKTEADQLISSERSLYSGVDSESRLNSIEKKEPKLGSKMISISSLQRSGAPRLRLGRNPSFRRRGSRLSRFSRRRMNSGVRG